MAVSDPAHPPTAPVEALDLFTGLLSEVDAEGPPDAFYSRMAEATCRLGGMRRAVIFAYDEERHSVRAVGAHGLDLELFAGASPTAEQVDMARRALAEDVVVEVTAEIERELPSEFHPLLMEGLLTCTPMSAGDRWFGVIVADRGPEAGPLTGAQRHTLWSLGKVAALAAGARAATRQHELARALSSRLDLARELHEAVVQRLFGVSLALSGEGELSEETRVRCREELGLALGELRSALQRPLARTPRATATTLLDELARLARHHDGEIEIGLVRGEDVEVPERLEPLVQSILREAIRNARKHASPERIEIALAHDDGTFALEVVNDGVGPRMHRATGVGLRLAAFEALEHGGLVEFGPAGEGRWRVRLAVPSGDTP